MTRLIDFYRLLGVSETATKEEIKKAYRKKAKEYHPDMGGSNEMFVRLQQAYETLYNDLKREHYDYIYYTRRKGEENNQTKRSKPNYETEGNTSNSTNRKENTDKSNQTNEENKNTKQPNSGKQNNKTGKSPTYASRLINWRSCAVISIVLNFALIFLLIDNYTYIERNSVSNTIETIVEPKENLFSQEDYNRILNDQSILEEQLSTVLGDYNEQADYIEELENKILEMNSIPTESPSINTTEIKKDEEKSPSIQKSFFTFGSTQDEIKQIMGTPDSIIGNMWGYGYSTITFSDGKVSGWSDNSNNLKVNIEKSGSNVSAFTIGSSAQDVVDAMGTPDSIIGNMWGYEYSTVTFSDGKVSGWSNNSNNLKLR